MAFHPYNISFRIKDSSLHSSVGLHKSISKMKSTLNRNTFLLEHPWDINRDWWLYCRYPVAEPHTPTSCTAKFWLSVGVCKAQHTNVQINVESNFCNFWNFKVLKQHFPRTYRVSLKKMAYYSFRPQCKVLQLLGKQFLFYYFLK